MFLKNPEEYSAIIQMLIRFFFNSLWILFSIWIIKEKKLLTWLDTRLNPLIRLKNVLTVFLIFLGMQIVFVPLLVSLLKNALESWHLVLSLSQQHLLNLSISILPYLSLLIYFYFGLEQKQKLSILGVKNSWYKNYCQGAISWFLIYPFVGVWSSIVNELISLFTHAKLQDQVAVEKFRATMSHPPLLIAMAVYVIIIVPIAEEFIFRGILQSWLKIKLNSVYRGVLLTGFIFALFHYSPEQGLANIHLLSSLFLLGSLLGYLYEKYQSLWVSIGLHSMFNGISALLITLGKE